MICSISAIKLIAINIIWCNQFMTEFELIYMFIPLFIDYFSQVIIAITIIWCNYVNSDNCY